MSRTIALATAVLFAALVAAPASAAGAQRFFQAPSGNIGCAIDRSSVRCDIRKRDWRPPSKPRSCEFDWGNYLSVRRIASRGTFACVSDAIADPRASKLAYGKSISAGTMRCTSRLDGMRCVNGRGRGFLLSRQRYLLF